MSAFDARPPYRSYAAIMSVFGGLLATAGAVGRLLDRDPQCQTALDFAVLAAASFKAAHTLSHDEVTSFIRQPFVRTWSLGAAAANDFLQAGFAALAGKANARTQARARGAA